MAVTSVLSYNIYLLINEVSHGYDREWHSGNPSNPLIHLSFSLPPKSVFYSVSKIGKLFFFFFGKDPNSE